MSWWDDVGNAISSAAEAVGNVVEDVVNAVSDAVTDVVETVGNAVEDAANAIGGALSGIPVVGGFLGGFFAWVGGIVAGITNFVGSVIKGVLGIVGGVIGGLIKVVGGAIGGLFSGNWSTALEGLIDIASSIAGAILSILGTFASLVQRIIFCQNNERKLTKAEIDMLRIVFQNSISLYDIRLIEGWSGIFGTTTNGAFTLNNTIYLNQTNLATNPEVLVHECVHVWQYQNHGNRYIGDALGAQAVYGRTGTSGDAYDWSAELARGKTDWNEFNAEAQAQLINEIWTDGTLVTGGVVDRSNGAFYRKQDCESSNGPGVCVETFQASRDSTDHTPLAINAVKELRGYWNFRLSHFI